MAPRAIGEGGPHSRGRRGRLDPREEGGGPASRWGPRGGGARKDPGGPVLRQPRYICPQSPGPPHSPSSEHAVSSRRRDTASARVSPAMAL